MKLPGSCGLGSNPVSHWISAGVSRLSSSESSPLVRAAISDSGGSVTTKLVSELCGFNSRQWFETVWWRWYQRYRILLVPPTQLSLRASRFDPVRASESCGGAATSDFGFCWYPPTRTTDQSLTGFEPTELQSCLVAVLPAISHSGGSTHPTESESFEVRSQQ